MSARNFAAAATAGRVLSSSPTTSSEVGVDDREGAVSLKRDSSGMPKFVATVPSRGS